MIAALETAALDFCPVNVLRPTFPGAISARTQAAMADVYNHALSRDVEGFNQLVRDVYSLDLPRDVTITEYSGMVAQYNALPFASMLSYRNLLRLNLRGCVWRTTPSLYKDLKHSIQGVDGDARYTWNTVLCSIVLIISSLAGSLKVSSNLYVQMAYSTATLVLYNTYFMFTHYGEYLVLASFMQLLLVIFFTIVKPRAFKLAKLPDSPGKGFGDMVVQLRGIIMSATIIAILAYDNIYFNRKCSKTFYSGYSAMDVGCGFMIMHSGCMAGLSKSSNRRGAIDVIKRNWQLFLLGIVRLLSTTAVNYDVPVEEYGIHWNFFMSLGTTKMLSEFILSAVPESMVPAIPVSIMVVFELLLHRYDMANLLPAIPRDSIFTANKEGIIAIPNSIAMFMLGYSVTKLCRKLHRERKLKSGAIVLAGVSISSVLGSAALYMLGLPSSRTLSNARFVMNTASIVFGGFFVLWMTDMMEQRVFYAELLRCIGKRSFVSFLLANLLTGAVNLFLQPLLLPFWVMYTLVSVYAATCFLFAVYLERQHLYPLGKHASRKE